MLRSMPGPVLLLLDSQMRELLFFMSLCYASVEESQGYIVPYS